MMSTLLKLGLSGYDVKPRFGAFQCEYLLQNPLFLGKNLGDTRQTYEKNEPPSIILGGGLHGKACWLIAYYSLASIYINSMLKAYIIHDMGLNMISSNAGIGQDSYSSYDSAVAGPDSKTYKLFIEHLPTIVI